MKLIINNDEFEIKECIKFKDRLLGLMFKKNFNYGLLFNKCSSIHTFFMRESIDVIGLDDNNNVINYKKNLRPYRFLNFKGAKKIIELPANSIKDKCLKIKFEN